MEFTGRLLGDLVEGLQGIVRKAIRESNRMLTGNLVEGLQEIYWKAFTGFRGRPTGDSV